MGVGDEERLQHLITYHSVLEAKRQVFSGFSLLSFFPPISQPVQSCYLYPKSPVNIVKPFYKWPHGYTHGCTSLTS